MMGVVKQKFHIVQVRTRVYIEDADTLDEAMLKVVQHNLNYASEQVSYTSETR